MPDLAHILMKAIHALQNAGLNPLLIDGYAVNYYGYTRSTVDIDLMLAMTDYDLARQALVRDGFSNVDEQDTVTFFQTLIEQLNAS